MIHWLPGRLDFHPTCFKTYELHFGSNEEYTNQVEHLIEDYNNYKGLIYPGNVSDIQCPNTEWHPMDEEFFTSTLYQSEDINPVSRWMTGDGTPMPNAMPMIEVAAKAKAKTLSMRLNEKSALLHKHMTDGPSEAIFNEVIKSGMEQLVKYQHEKVRHSSERRTVGLASVPATDKRAEYVRLAPACSPGISKKRRI